MKKYIVPFIVLVFAWGIVNAQVDRSKAPQPGPAPKVQIGDYTKFELPNGLKVFVVEDHRLPRVSFSLSFFITPELEGANTGIGTITSELIGTGTKTRTKDQINEEIDFISGSLNASSEGIYASSLKKHIVKLLDLYADVTINSVFTEKEMEKSRTQFLSGLASSKDDPNTIASHVSSAVIYGKNHPYGEFETEASIKSLNLDMCNKYYAKYFRPNVACMSIVGDITPAEAKQLIQKYFGNWQKADVPVLTYPKSVIPEASKVIIVNRDESVQSVINVCYPVDLNLANPDFIKVSVANTVLGGGIFRLFTNLREKHAYTYGAYSRFSTNPLASGFRASTSTRNSVTDSAIFQILYEMKRMSEEPVPDKELLMVKNYLMGNFALSLENPQTIASFAINTERYKLPQDFYTNYLKNIEAVTAADILAVSKKYILPQQSNILVVGKASEIEGSLKKFSANGTIEYLDSEANPYNPALKSKVIPEGVNASKVIEAYIDAMGGKANLTKVKDFTYKAAMSMQGMPLSINIKCKTGSKYLMEIQMNGQVMQKLLYNNGVGKTSGMQGNSDIQGKELEKLKLETEIAPELKYTDLGYKAELKEITDVNGKDAYVVEVTSPLNDISTDYYSVETGLKVKSVSTMDSPMGKFTQTKEIVEYTQIDGVKYPKVVKQSMGPQTVEITVESVTVNSGIKDEVFN